jgi:hypothetical protein
LASCWRGIAQAVDHDRHAAPDPLAQREVLGPALVAGAALEAERLDGGAHAEIKNEVHIGRSRMRRRAAPIKSGRSLYSERSRNDERATAFGTEARRVVVPQQAPVMVT